MKIVARTHRPHQYKAHADFALMAYWNTVMCEPELAEIGEAKCCANPVRRSLSALLGVRRDGLGSVRG